MQNNAQKGQVTTCHDKDMVRRARQRPHYLTERGHETVEGAEEQSPQTAAFQTVSTQIEKTLVFLTKLWTIVNKHRQELGFFFKMELIFDLMLL